MHGLGLASGLSFCVVDDELVLLDLVSDSYFQLRSAEADALRNAALYKNISPHSLSLLKRAGILEPKHHTTEISPITRRPPDVSLLDISSPGASSISSVARVSILVWWVRASLHLGRLAGLVDSLRLAKIKCCGSKESLNELALSFVASRRWVPLATGCLPDSLALAFYLARRGFDVDLVVGVKLNPFAAHAWVQHRGVVLNDELDGVLDFTPILVV